MTAPRIEIVIDRLVFHGLPEADARRAAATFETRLAALAREAHGPIRPRTEGFRPTVPVRAGGASHDALGTAVAGAVARAVWGGGR
jgi:hypothetical protein